MVHGCKPRTKSLFWQTNKTSDQAPDASAGETAGEAWYHGWSTGQPTPPKRTSQKNLGLIRTYKGKPMVNKHSIRPYFLGVTLGGCLVGWPAIMIRILRSYMYTCNPQILLVSWILRVPCAWACTCTWHYSNDFKRVLMENNFRMVSESKAYTREVTAGYALSVASWIPFFIHKHEFATTILFARWNEIFWANQHTVANDETLLTGR